MSTLPTIDRQPDYWMDRTGHYTFIIFYFVNFFLEDLCRDAKYCYGLYLMHINGLIYAELYIL